MGCIISLCDLTGVMVRPWVDAGPVEVAQGYSDQHKLLGGKSLKTKNIRSATPRGFAQAVFLANSTNKVTL